MPEPREGDRHAVIDRSKLSREERYLLEGETMMLAADPLKRPPCFAIPQWPYHMNGAALQVIRMAAARRNEGLNPVALGVPFEDGSAMVLTWQTERERGVPERVYDELGGGATWLKVQVFDRGRPRPHAADHAYGVLEQAIGAKWRRQSILGRSLDPNTAARATWWRMDA